jgi:hypothetical protein
VGGKKLKAIVVVGLQLPARRQPRGENGARQRAREDRGRGEHHVAEKGGSLYGTNTLMNVTNTTAPRSAKQPGHVVRRPRRSAANT